MLLIYVGVNPWWLCTLITIISEVLAIVHPTAAQTSGSSFCVNIFVLLSLVLPNFEIQYRFGYQICCSHFYSTKEDKKKLKKKVLLSAFIFLIFTNFIYIL